MPTINYYKKNFVSFIIFSLIVFSFISCVKTQAVSPLDFQKNLLAGTGAYQNTKHSWKIDSLSVNGTVYKLNAAQKKIYQNF